MRKVRQYCFSTELPTHTPCCDDDSISVPSDDHALPGVHGFIHPDAKPLASSDSLKSNYCNRNHPAVQPRPSKTKHSCDTRSNKTAARSKRARRVVAAAAQHVCYGMEPVGEKKIFTRPGVRCWARGSKRLRDSGPESAG